MGYRVWNNYEEDAERERREAIARIPFRARAALRLKQALVLAAFLTLPVIVLLKLLGIA